MIRNRSILFVCLAVVLQLTVTPDVFSQSAAVTLKLDSNQIAVGGTTTLHVFAQVLPSLRPAADRIFSFYLDLLNSNGAMADSTGAITKPSSDKDPETSSSGFLDGANRRGIYDTFLNLPGAGVTTPVELFSVPIKGLSQGTVTFKIQAGTGVPGLSEDFIVAPTGGGNPLVGGDYSQASAQLVVGAGGCQSQLSARLNVVSGKTNQIVLSFTSCPKSTAVLEFTADLGHPNWQPLPGVNGASGSANDPATAPARFYRVRLTTP
jgi:hypothetical protein